MKLQYSDGAEADIISIGRHIALDDRQTAIDFLERLRSFIEEIPARTEIYRLRIEWGASIRAANFRGYLILFETSDTTLTILRVANGKRDIARVLREGRQ